MTDVERERRIQDLLLEAWDLPEGERREVLSAACDDTGLVAEVLSMLGEESALGGFLEEPVAARLPGAVLSEAQEETADLPAGVSEASGAVRRAGVSLRDLAILGVAAQEQDQIGPYRLVEVLGEGGMGQVFRAEQTEPVERSVALKLIRGGLASDEAVIRFEAERQALARLTHPNIAQMYEAGTMEDGRPYFAMELVDGPPITTYCDQRDASLEERLALFVAVCRGIQHAHQKQLLHRDLKPSNILVTEVEGEARPKIIDFGIAKALDRPLTDATFLTREMIGTPSYMSPESLVGESQPDPDTRTDVYGLGVLLYELLTGTRPFDTRGLGVVEILNRVTGSDAPRPSLRFAALELEEQEVAATRRGMRPDALRRSLRGDLDAIVGRAVARDRRQRYGAVVELAADIERYLRHEPVLATPPSMPYLVSRFLRRHWQMASLAALLLIALTAGAIAFRSEARRASRAARVAEEALVKVLGELRKSEAARRKRARIVAFFATPEIQLGLSEVERTITAYDSRERRPLALGEEIYGARIRQLLFNPPEPEGSRRAGGPSRVRIELQGPPRADATGLYLILLAGNGGEGGIFNPGEVSGIANLTGFSFGANGRLVMSDGGSEYATDPRSTVFPLRSTGFFIKPSRTFLLVASEVTPAAGDDIDENDDGTPDGQGYAEWRILDSVSVVDDDDPDEYGYGAVVFAQDPAKARVPPGAVVVDTNPFEAGYLARAEPREGDSADGWIAGAVGGSYPDWELVSGETRPARFGGLPLDDLLRDHPVRP